MSIRDLHFHIERGLEGEKDLSPRNSAFKLPFSAYCKHICDWMLSIALTHPTSLLQVSSSDLDTAWKLIQYPMAFGDLCHSIRFCHFFFFSSKVLTEGFRTNSAVLRKKFPWSHCCFPGSIPVVLWDNIFQEKNA